MPFNSESHLANKIKDILLKRGYSVKVQPTVEIENSPVVIDFLASNNNDIFLIEVNNGIRVNMNDISQLIRYSNQIRNEESNKRLSEFIITDKLEKIDPEVKKISEEKNIKIITVDILNQSGLN